MFLIAFDMKYTNIEFMYSINNMLTNQAERQSRNTSTYLRKYRHFKLYCILVFNILHT